LEGSEILKIVIFSSVGTAKEQRSFHKMARSCVAAGQDVVLIARHQVSEVLDGVRIVAVPSPRNRLMRMSCTSLRVFAHALLEKGDVYQFSDPELILLGFLLQFLTQRPVVYDLREYHADRIREKFWLPKSLRTPMAYFYELLERVIVPRFAGVVVVNEDLASRLRTYGCFRIAVVPNYAPQAVFAVLTPRHDALEGRYKGNRVVIHMGGLSQDREILQAVRAMVKVRESVPNAKLLLVGPFDEASFEKKVRQLVAELALGDGVEIVGRISYSSVPTYFAISEVGLCLLLPTCHRHEQCEPIKHFEYAAAGIPQVVGDLPALRRLVEKNRNGILVDPRSEDEIAKAIVQLLQNDALAKEMGERGRQAFCERYNWESVFARLLKLYWEVNGK
jgi:glycosyltransferase involved in cell wall biosynthesis